MRIDIHGQHIDVTPALRDYVATRFERLARHVEQPFDVRTVLAVEKSRQWAEATVTLAGRTVHADADASTSTRRSTSSPTSWTARCSATRKGVPITTAASALRTSSRPPEAHALRRPAQPRTHRAGRRPA